MTERLDDWPTTLSTPRDHHRATQSTTRPHITHNTTHMQLRASPLASACADSCCDVEQARQSTQRRARFENVRFCPRGGNQARLVLVARTLDCKRIRHRNRHCKPGAIEVYPLHQLLLV
jgi:hypothetical protein